jgi:hypothetical protein
VEEGALWKGVSRPDKCAGENLEIEPGLLRRTPLVFLSEYAFMLLATLRESSSEVIPLSSDSRVPDRPRERER